LTTKKSGLLVFSRPAGAIAIGASMRAGADTDAAAEAAAPSEDGEAPGEGSEQK
jgi:hypothetical protein